MNTQIPPLARFSQVFDSVVNEVPFNPEWNNGTGYLDKSTKDSSINLGKGEMARCITEGHKEEILNNRRVLFVGLGDGTQVTIFERYSGGERGYVVSNIPRGLSGFEERTNSHTSFFPETLDLILNDEVFK